MYAKRQLFEVHLNSVISFVFVAFCQPRILRYSACDVTDIFAIHVVYPLILLKQIKKARGTYPFEEIKGTLRTRLGYIIT